MIKHLKKHKHLKFKHLTLKDVYSVLERTCPNDSLLSEKIINQVIIQENFKEYQAKLMGDH
jgi:hypothetical protein